MRCFDKAGAALLMAVMLAGCGDGGSEAKVTVDEVEPGLYVASTGSADALVVGRYFAAQDGSRLLALDDTQGRATALYRRSATGAWQAVPSSGQEVSLPLLQSHALPVPKGLGLREAACLPENTPSRGVLERAGFKYEGVAQSYLQINGRWRNHVLYSNLRHDRRGKTEVR